MPNNYAQHLTNALRHLSKAERAIFIVLIYLIIAFTTFDLSRCSHNQLNEGSGAYEAGNVEEALRLYQEAGDQGDQAILEMARELQANGDYEKAIVCFKSLTSDEEVSYDRKNSASRELLDMGHQFEEEQDYALALECFEASSKPVSTKHTYFCKGMLSLKHGDSEKAAKSFLKSEGLGDKQLKKMASQAKKEGHTKQAATYLSYCSNKKLSQKGHYALGKYQLSDGHYKAAVKQFSKAGNKGKKKLHTMAQSAYDQHDWKKASLCYRNIGNNKSKQYAELCTARYQFEKGHYSAALATLQGINTKGMSKSFKQTVRDYAVECHYQIGSSQYANNHWVKAYKHLKKAKGYQDADYMLGVCKQKISETKAAERD